MNCRSKLRKRAIIALCSAALLSTTIPALPAFASTEVAQPIVQALTRLIQVEKVADDSYSAFFTSTGEKRFKTVISQEGTHENRLALVLAINGVTNPIALLKPGQFSSPELQTLYDEIIRKGSVSKKAALAVAVNLEKADIAQINNILTMKPPAYVAKLLTDMRAQSQTHVKLFSN